MRSIIIDQGADDSLHRAERALQWILSEGQGVLLVFVVVYGDGSDADGEWLKLTRGLLSLEQPVYGIAIGAMSDASLALLEACDCVFSSLPQPTACRLLHPVEIATVCEIIGTETSGMGFQEIKAGRAQENHRQPFVISVWTYSGYPAFQVLETNTNASPPQAKSKHLQCSLF